MTFVRSDAAMPERLARKGKIDIVRK